MEDRTQGTQSSRPSASMVELKAELFKKKQELQKDRVANFNAVKGRKHDKISLKKKTNVWDQKNAGVSVRAQRDIPQSEEHEDVLLKSRTILEKKSKIYDAISSSANIPDEDGSEGYLVDFQKKTVDAIVEERERMRREEEDKAEREALDEPISEPEHSDEEWIDYTDSLGRSRRCLKKDLKDIKKDDKNLARSLNQNMTGTEEEPKRKDGGESASLHLVSNDMYREKMRQKWEDEATQLLEKGQEEIHYSNVQFDEIRNHGVGFYQFSKDQQERGAQMEKLKDLREETKTERSRKEKIQDKRKAMLEARLAKVKERRKLKTKEIPAEDEETEIGPKLSEADKEEMRREEEVKRKKEEVEKAAEEARKKFVREWDEKKKTASSWLGDKYADIRRCEREAEFAPPSMYFNEATPSAKSAVSALNFRNKNVVVHKQNIQHQTFKVNGHNDGKRHRENLLKASPNPSASNLSSSSLNLSSVNQEVNTSAGNPMPCIDISVDSIPLPSISQCTNENKPNLVTASSRSNLDNSNHSEAMQRQPTNQLSFLQPIAYQYANDSMVGQTQNDDYTPSPVPVASAYHATMQHQVSWQQEQLTPPIPQQQQQQPQQQQQWPQQQQWFSHQTTPSIPDQQPTYHCHPGQAPPTYTQTQAGQGPPANASSNQTNACYSSQSASSACDFIGYNYNKRSFSQDTEDSSSESKKPKVPKSAIVDNRFMLNSESTSDSRAMPTVQAVPYKPGSFTEARFKQVETPLQEDETLHVSERKAQLSGGPMLYTAEQQQKQLDLMKEDEGSNTETNEKVEEFLKSIRNETT